MGPFLKFILDLPTDARRFILVVVVIAVIYPLFVVFGVLSAIALLPPKAQHPVATYIRYAIGSRADGVEAVNLNNKTIDGTVPLRFDVTLGGKVSDQSYFQAADSGEQIDLISYETHGSGTSSDPKCANPPLPENFGKVHLKIPNTSFDKSVTVRSSIDSVYPTSAVAQGDWKTDPTLKTLNQTEFLVSLSLDQDFATSQYAKCFPVTVYLNMVFRKPSLN